VTTCENVRKQEREGEDVIGESVKTEDERTRRNNKRDLSLS